MSWRDRWNRLFASTNPATVRPPAPDAWNAQTVGAWLDEWGRRGLRRDPSARFEWLVRVPGPTPETEAKSGTVLEWAIDARATALVRRLLAADGLPASSEGSSLRLMERLSFYHPHPDIEAVPIARLLHAAGHPLEIEDLESAVFHQKRGMMAFLLPHLAARGPLPSSLAARAASVGASDEVVLDLIEAGLRFDASDLTTNIAFMGSSGTTAVRQGRTAHWLELLAAHDAHRQAAHLDQTLPAAVPALAPSPVETPSRRRLRL